MKTKLNQKSIKINGITDAFDVLNNLDEEARRQKNSLTESSNDNYPTLHEIIRALRSTFEQFSHVDNIELGIIAKDIQNLMIRVANDDPDPIPAIRRRLKQELPQLDI